MTAAVEDEVFLHSRSAETITFDETSVCVCARERACGLSSGIIAFKRENGHISWCGGAESALGISLHPLAAR